MDHSKRTMPLSATTATAADTIAQELPPIVAATGTATVSATVTATAAATSNDTQHAVNVGVWQTDEHERYLQAKFANPKASWKEIAQLVGTRSARQVILHDQKFRAKMERRLSKSARAMAPRGRKSAGEEMRYIDSMGVLLLASVASSRLSKVPDRVEAVPAEAAEANPQAQDEIREKDT